MAPAKMKSWPGGKTEPGPSAQYSACAFFTSLRFGGVGDQPVDLAWSSTVPSGFIGGPYTRYCEPAPRRTS